MKRIEPTHFIEWWKCNEGFYKLEPVYEIKDIDTYLKATLTFGTTIAIFKIYPK